MRKLIILFSSVVILLSLFLVLFNSLKDEEQVEKTYSVRTNYAYLSDGEIHVVFKVYSNKLDSLLKYANQANVTLHNRNKENVITVSVVESYLSDTTVYKGKELYEYSFKTLIDITDFIIEDCYMTAKFSNKSYIFYIGKFEVIKSNCLVNKLPIIDLYGLSSEDDISLSGILVTLKNSRDKSVDVSDIVVGNDCEIKVYSENVSPKEATKIDAYLDNEMDAVDSVRIGSKESKTILIEIDNKSELYFCNSYIFLTVDGVRFYIENFTYINSNDLDGLHKYIKEGIVYDV